MKYLVCAYLYLLCAGSVAARPQSEDVASADTEALSRRRPVLYQHIGYRGKSLNLDREYTNLQHQYFNDAGSSITVPAGWDVELYANKDFIGPMLEVRGPNRVWNLREYGFNDKTSSVKVFRGGALLCGYELSGQSKCVGLVPSGHSPGPLHSEDLGVQRRVLHPPIVARRVPAPRLLPTRDPEDPGSEGCGELVERRRSTEGQPGPLGCLSRDSAVALRHGHNLAFTHTPVLHGLHHSPVRSQLEAAR